jgi:protoporphyrinogen oxidase
VLTVVLAAAIGLLYSGWQISVTDIMIADYMEKKYVPSLKIISAREMEGKLTGVQRKLGGKTYQKVDEGCQEYSRYR